jgi:beta-lactamase regulating signal transducer with metallopeptidase domain
MLAWMSYVIAVSLLLSFAALALEHAACIRQKPTRWLWATAMVASLLLPLVVSSVSVQIPRLAGVGDPARSERVVALRDMTATELSPSAWTTAAVGEAAASPDLDRLLQVGWAVASTALVLTILTSAMQLRQRRRRWERGDMAGMPVHVSEDTGPAIAGLLRPHIVVPRWLTRCPPEVQELVVAHEQSHLEARDAHLVMIALGLLVCMPWNVPLWWQLRRLRLAIEIDCDARVLRRGYDVSRYGEALIAVGERQSTIFGLAAAMSEPESQLERRLRNMLRKRTRHSVVTAAALACLGIACAAGAAEISPPDNRVAQGSAAEAARVDGHIGFYRVNDEVVLTIARDGPQLTAQFSGRPPVPIFPRSNTEFSYKDKSISFITNADGRTSSLVLRQYGIDMLMKRIDAATAAEMASVRVVRSYRPKPERIGALIILQ